ncbi:MAG: hypothetical protein ABW217_03820 [Polyangiaceae bacterium]
MKQDTRGMLQDEHGRGAASGKRDLELEQAKAALTDAKVKHAAALASATTSRRWWMTGALVLFVVHARELLMRLAYVAARLMDEIGDRFGAPRRW